MLHFGIYSGHTSHMCAFIEILYYMTDFKMIARVEYRGCVFSIKSQLGTKQKGAFIEGVHLWRVYLWRVDCICFRQRMILVEIVESNRQECL